jgi:peptidoglycan/LPS O-acetylase OafA/YrhL
MQVPKNGTIASLTGFRWLAASLVFVYHNRKYWRDQLPDQIDHLFSEFHIGVSLFFILSGYLITMSYGSKPLQSKKQYAKYTAQRIARIYPMYWLILLAYTIDPAYGAGQWNLLLFSLGHGFSNQLNLNGISQAWSLTVEMSYYLIAPLITKMMVANGRYILLLLPTTCVCLFLTGYFWNISNGNPQSFLSPLLFVLNGTIGGQLLFFVAGASLVLFPNHSLFGKGLTHKTWLGTLGVICTMALSSIFHQTPYDQANQYLSGTLFQLLLISFFGRCWIQGLTEEHTIQSKIFSSPVFVLLGNASFIFYLIHISYVNQKIKEYILLPDRNYILLWLASCLLYILIEKPLYSFCRRLINKW